MHLRHRVRACSIGASLIIAAAAAAPAMAQPGPYPGAPPPGPEVRPEWRGDRAEPPIAPGPGYDAAADAREAWLDECRHRTLGRFDCEAYLDDYYAHYYGGRDRGWYGYPGMGYRHPGYAYPGPYPAYAYPAYGPGYSAPPKPNCTETVTYEDVAVPVRPRVRHAPEKRVRIVPEKRTKIVPRK
jgi:hypothetical protein